MTNIPLTSSAPYSITYTVGNALYTTGCYLTRNAASLVWSALWSPIQTLIDTKDVFVQTYHVLGPFMGKRWLIGYTVAHTAITLAGEVMIMELSGILNKQVGVISEQEIALGEHTPEAWHSYEEALFDFARPFAMMLVGSAIHYAINSGMNYYFTKKLHSVYDHFFTQDTFKACQTLKEGPTKLIKARESDFPQLAATFQLCATRLSSLWTGFSAFPTLYAVSQPVMGFIPDFLTFAIATRWGLQFVTNKVAYYSTLASNASERHEIREVETLHEAIHQTGTLATDPALATFMKERQSKERNAALNISVKQQLLFFGKNIWDQVNTYAVMFSEWLLMAHKIFQNTLLYKDKVYILHLVGTLGGAITWGESNQYTIQAIKKSLSDIREILTHKQKAEAVVSPLKRAPLDDPKVLFRIENMRLYTHADTPLVINNLEIAKGQRVVLVGPSGVGKSTFLHTLLGILPKEPHTTGTISSSCLEQYAIVPQKPYFPKEATILEAIYCNSKAVSEETKKQQIAFITPLLHRLSITRAPADTVEGLSGGEQKRIAILGAIVRASTREQKPQLLVLDEVFTGLDPKAIEPIQRLILELLPGITIMAVDHEPEAHNRFVQSGRESRVHHDLFYQYKMEIHPATKTLDALEAMECPSPPTTMTVSACKEYWRSQTEQERLSLVAKVKKDPIARAALKERVTQTMQWL